MYKAINVNEDTYQELQKIATQLNKPKAQVVQSLVATYGLAIQKEAKKKLDAFNTEMDAKIKALRLSKRITFNPNTMDADFSALADTDYMR